MKICVLGSSGMLGWTVGKYFLNKYGQDEVLLSARNSALCYSKHSFIFDALSENIFIPEHCEYVINCIGTIKPHVGIKISILDTIQINSIFPYKLAEYCSKNGMNLIQISTDCVYSGIKGNYIETDLHDATDIYGKSKSLGEPKNCMIIRTSIIGEELHNKVSLIEWAKFQKDKTVKGYTNHLWNGITTKQYAKVIEKIIDDNLYAKELYHIFSPNSITKCDLLKLISDKFNLNFNIEPIMANGSINRTLNTIKYLNDYLQISDIEEQILQM